jgi:hypothetical protein
MFKKGDIAVNVYSQEVEITDIDNDSIVFVNILNDSVDVLRIEEFNRIYKITNKIEDDMMNTYMAHNSLNSDKYNFKAKDDEDARHWIINHLDLSNVWSFEITNEKKISKDNKIKS